MVETNVATYIYRLDWKVKMKPQNRANGYVL